MFNKTMSKRLLQYSVIGLGFGMNVEKALASGSEGMLFTVVSVFGTLALGWVIGRKLLGVDAQTSYLLSSGTAICGGSAIAAVGPTLKAKAESMSVALGVVFILNAVALFVFPPVGDVLSMKNNESVIMCFASLLTAPLNCVATAEAPSPRSAELPRI